MILLLKLRTNSFPPVLLITTFHHLSAGLFKMIHGSSTAAVSRLLLMSLFHFSPRWNIWAFLTFYLGLLLQTILQSDGAVKVSDA